MKGNPDPATLGRVRALVARVLRIDEALVGADTALVAELGAESIDLLELRFLLEKEFRLRVTVKELMESAGLQSAADVAKGLSAAAIARAVEERLVQGGKP